MIDNTDLYKLVKKYKRAMSPDASNFDYFDYRSDISLFEGTYTDDDVKDYSPYNCLDSWTELCRNHEQIIVQFVFQGTKYVVSSIYKAFDTKRPETMIFYDNDTYTDMVIVHEFGDEAVAKAIDMLIHRVRSE